MEGLIKLKKAGIIAFFLVAYTFSCPLIAQDSGNPEGYLKGYSRHLKGETFSYHSAQPDVNQAMLVRSLEKEMYIEWESQEVPGELAGKEATFVMMAAINVRPDGDSYHWDLLIDNEKQFTINTPSERNLAPVEWTGNKGFKLLFRPVMIDQHGDVHGYMFLTVPSSYTKPGKALNIKAIGESAGSRAFFIVYRYGMEPLLRLIPEQAIRNEDGSSYQQIRIEYVYMGSPLEVNIEAANISTRSMLKFGYNSVSGRIPVLDEPEDIEVSLKNKKTVIASDRFTVNPVKPRTIYLLHHSHTDIGYTHVQDDVKKIQWQHLENAIKYARASENNPEGARFRWNSEVMWAIESYMEENSPEKTGLLKEAIKKGWIEVNGLYAHMLSELCNTEELIRLTLPARKLAKETGITAESAMITDVPGWSWGLVPVLGQSGIKYLSLGTNHGHRIGHILDEWADRPFWWVSPSGEEKVLCWIHRNGYSMFHTGLNADKMPVEKVSTRIFDYLNQVEDAAYPYEIVPVRYSIGADNGPPDAGLCDLVMEWNRRFETPKLKISTVSETFSEFEKIYGDKLPSVRGALTGYWEDGAASSAKMTGLNRQAANTANIAGALKLISSGPGSIEKELFPIWKNITLYDEHTWGSWNSISDPLNEFTLSQWAVKSSFAREAALQSYKLKDNILGIDPAWRNPDGTRTSPLYRVEVINPHSWTAGGAVEIPPSWNIKGSVVKDEKGNIIESQLLSTGQLYYIAENIPAYGSKIYYFNKGVPVLSEAENSNTYIENDMFRLELDKETGSISSLYSKSIGRELVDKKSGLGLNTYQYVEGRLPVNVSGPEKPKIEIIEDGDLLSVIKVVSQGRGIRSLTSYYTLVKGVDRVYITNVCDKLAVYKQEGVHFAFPFYVPKGKVNIDLALGAYTPGAGQVKGACMNYYTPERWVDVSNQDYGVSLIPLDAPLIEIGEITTDPVAYGWLDKPKDSQLIYSYVMNNYWETNYLAAQDGIINFRYVIAPHRAFSSAFAEKTAMEENERLVIVPDPDRQKGRDSLFKIENNGVIVTTVIPDDDGYLIRLFNAGGNPQNLTISWKEKPEDVFFTDLDGKRSAGFEQGTLIPAWGLRTLKVLTE